MSYNDYWYPPQSFPKKLTGGIKTQTKRGAFASNWWSKLWVENFESRTYSARLIRARSYARGGQTKELEIAEGLIRASVQGSVGKPYEITVSITPFTPEQIEAIYQELDSQPMIVAQLLNNSIPEELGKLLTQLKLSLIPAYNKNMKVSCDCPDRADPCKHSASILYLIAEEIDKDPFLLLKMLGIAKDKLLEKLNLKGIKAEPAEQAGEAFEPLTANPEEFWGKAWQKPIEPVSPPLFPAAIIRRLGTIAFWRSESDFIKLMEDSYANAAKKLRELQRQD